MRPTATTPLRTMKKKIARLQEIPKSSFEPRLLHQLGIGIKKGNYNPPVEKKPPVEERETRLLGARIDSGGSTWLLSVRLRSRKFRQGSAQLAAI